MENQIRQLLLSLDDADRCETPKDFNYQFEINKVKSIKVLIEKVINHEMGIDEYVQDASFYTELFILEENEKKRRDLKEGFVIRHDLSIRFSAFGNLVTIFSHTQDDLQRTFPIQEIISLLRSHGYIYIEAEQLDEPYDGVNKYINSKDTWWIRYFDYL